MATGLGRLQVGDTGLLNLRLFLRLFLVVDAQKARRRGYFCGLRVRFWRAGQLRLVYSTFYKSFGLTF